MTPRASIPKNRLTRRAALIYREPMTRDQALSEIADVAGSAPRLPDANLQHRTISAALTKAGWDVHTEITVAYHDGVYPRNGRIDIEATKDGITAAIEIDRRQPRTRSVLKLRAMVVDVRLVLLREIGIKCDNAQVGIDGVIVIGSSRGLGRFTAPPL